MAKDSKEWIAQALYDYETAKIMFSSKRNWYAVFMCHMALEKALKGVFHKTKNTIPPKTHNLIYLLNKIGIKPAIAVAEFIIELSEANIATRYPEEMSKLTAIYTKEKTSTILDSTLEALEWIKKLL